MKQPPIHPFSIILGLFAAVLFSSCAYDPYYSGSAGGSYGSNYGYGYGYGGSGFSTSLFVSTGNPRWGYDPYCRSYYDYNRHCYYDPYLYGYYPVGYRPPVVVGAPHPHGWRPGKGTCPPPQKIKNVRVKNYNNRIEGYRALNHSWARKVHMAPGNDRGRPQGRNDNNSPNRPDNRNNASNRPPSNRTYYQSVNERLRKSITNSPDTNYRSSNNPRTSNNRTVNTRSPSLGTPRTTRTPQITRPAPPQQRGNSATSSSRSSYSPSSSRSSSRSYSPGSSTQRAPSQPSQKSSYKRGSTPSYDKDSSSWKRDSTRR